jgi:3-deoxy-D-manno-octulosonic-acid transferase
MDFLYTLGILLYGLGIRMASLFNAKAKAWVSGRRGGTRKLKEIMASGKDRYVDTFWFHCASLGEFEQGKPVMEALREKYPQFRLVVTFYSPSGYEPRKDYSGADGVLYLPLDTPLNARKWVKIIQPKLAFFIKYEYWFNFLKALKKNGTPVFVLSARFHPKQIFFQWYGTWFRKQLKLISWFYLQDASVQKQVDLLGLKNYTISGDTRFDRVMKTRLEKPDYAVIEQFKGNKPLVIGGSTWEPEEALLTTLLQQQKDGVKCIIAPHEVHPERLDALEERLRKTLGLSDQASIIRFSSLYPTATKSTQPPADPNAETLQRAAKAQILLVDSIGILSKLYRYGTISLIGGGFGSGLHNILEAAAFGQPIFFGPRYDRFEEAKELIHLGGAFSVPDANAFSKAVTLLLDNPEALQKVSKISLKFVENNQGATRRILQGIQTLGYIGAPKTT